MTDTINKLATNKIRESIENLLKDNEQFYTSGEYNYNPDVIRCSCDTSFQTNRIPEEDYERYKNILEQVNIFRNIQGSNARSEKSMKNYLEDMIFWK